MLRLSRAGRSSRQVQSPYSQAENRDSQPLMGAEVTTVPGRALKPLRLIKSVHEVAQGTLISTTKVANKGFSRTGPPENPY